MVYGHHEPSLWFMVTFNNDKIIVTINVYEPENPSNEFYGTTLAFVNSN